MNRVSRMFGRFAEATAKYAGKPVAFFLAALTVGVWASTGPVFHFGDTWQLVINTGTTIVTFLMVFLIQNSQNRESSSLHIKLDELIRVTAAQNSLLDLEEVDDETLDKIRAHYRQLAGRQATNPAKQEPPNVPAPTEQVFPEVDRELKKFTAQAPLSASMRDVSESNDGTAT